MKCLKRLLQGCICAATAISLTSGIAFAAETDEPTETSVAKVGDKYYDSLSEAVKAIESEGTITLVNDVTLGEKVIIPKEKSVTLDLNGHTIDVVSTFVPDTTMFLNRGTFTVCGDGVIDATNNNGIQYPIENSGGHLQITSGKIIGNKEVIRVGNNGNNYGSAVISGGELLFGSSNGTYAIHSVAHTKVEIKGDAQISGNTAAVSVEGGELSISENASLKGQFGVLLFNSTNDNDENASHAKLTMTGGTVEATYGFALSGNNLQSALCGAEITGGTLLAPQDATAIYWPMEGELTVGGNATVEGGTGIEAKMGTITIKDQAQIIGTGAFLEDAPNDGGSQAEGSAILASAQMYGASSGQYIETPNLRVNIQGGTMTGTQGNAITVYNTERVEGQAVTVAVTDGELVAAQGKAGVRVIMASEESQAQLKQEEDSNALAVSKSNTTVSVSSAVVAAAADQNGKTSYYTSVADALQAEMGDQTTPMDVYVLSDASVTQEALTDEHIRLTTAKGVDLKIHSEVDGMIVKETQNEDGSKTYELVEDSALAAPTVVVKANATKVHAGDTITLTATPQHPENVTYAYVWYKDGVALEGETAATLQVSEDGSYAVGIVAMKTDGAATLYSAQARSQSIDCTIEPHQYVWTVIKEATTTAEGLRQQICSICNRVGAEETLPKLSVSSDRSQLAALLEQVAKLDEQAYTEESWKALLEARTQAEETMAAADVEQAQVDAAYAKLLAAYQGLQSVTQTPAQQPSTPTVETGQTQGHPEMFAALLLIAGAAITTIIRRRNNAA